MASPGKPVTAKRLRIMVELVVERNSSPESVFRITRDLASAGFEVDETYGPVKLRPPGEERERIESAGQELVLVRGTIDPARKSALEQHRDVYRVWTDVQLAPFAAPKQRPRKRGRRPRPGVTGPARGSGRSSAGATNAASQKAKTRRRSTSAAVGFAPPMNCGSTVVGTVSNALVALGTTKVWKRRHVRGAGVEVGVVDGGITAIGRPVKLGEVAVIDRVVNGWPAADWGTTALGWGPTNAQHGNMVAYDVLAMAPQSKLWDLRIWEDVPGTPAERFAVYVTKAIEAYRFAIDRFNAAGLPQILTNSWGLYDRNNGIDWATDPRHPFTLMVEEALDAGMLVLFAAGNCGTGCPHGSTSPCGATDRGPGNSILGPNGHPRVMTVGGADAQAQWYGYTSQGPAVLPPNAAKPDFCSVTQFAGFFPFIDSSRPCDGGTSAACATAAGVVALLKSYRPTLTQAQAKTALMNTARDIQAPGLDMDSGAGILQAYTALTTI